MKRTQCPECPWRNLDEIEERFVEHAKDHPDEWVCHTRMGPCPGPRLALEITDA